MERFLFSYSFHLIATAISMRIHFKVGAFMWRKKTLRNRIFQAEKRRRTSQSEFQIWEGKRLRHRQEQCVVCETGRGEWHKRSFSFAVQGCNKKIFYSLKRFVEKEAARSRMDVLNKKSPFDHGWSKFSRSVSSGLLPASNSTEQINARANFDLRLRLHDAKSHSFLLGNRIEINFARG